MRPLRVSLDEAMRATPKSRIFDLAVGRDEQIRRLDVAMDDAARVREGQPLADARS